MKSFIVTALLSIFLLQSSFCNIEFTILPPSIQDMQEVASNILKDLKAAKGILPTQPPFLRVRRLDGGQKIAIMRGDTMHLDIRTYNICKSMGRDSLNALSFIIGHELGHRIHKHGQTNHDIDRPSTAKAFAIINVEPPDNLNNADFQKRFSNGLKEYIATHNEAEADFEGAFLGYLAGYDPMNAGAQLLRKVYSDTLNGLSANTPGYPSLSDRIAIVTGTGTNLSKITPLFETAKYLTAIGQYADAVPFLEEVAEMFESREVYNNIGVLHILQCMRNMPDKLTRLQFPITLDSEFRAPHPQFFVEVEGVLSPSIGLVAKSFELCEISLLQQLLEDAERYFQKAINLDPEYALAYLNLSIAQSIKGLLYTSSVCAESKEEELAKASVNAFKASEILKKDLQGFSLEHFDFIPSDLLFPVSYPENNLLKTSDELTIIEISISIGANNTPVSVEIFRQGKYPFWKEKFNIVNLSHVSAIDNTTSLFTKWNTTEGQAPVAGVLLSNVYVQIDIIKILSNELTDNMVEVHSRTRIGTVRIVPFERALEINPDNVLAHLNRQIMGIPVTVAVISTSTPPLQNQIVQFESKDVSDIQMGISKWNITKRIPKSQLTSFFISGKKISIFDSDKMNIEEVPVDQTLKYVETGKFKMYFNQSEMNVDGRVEKSIILVPNTFTSLSITDSINIPVGIHIDSVNSMIGNPSGVINLTKGRLATYKTFHSKDSFQRVRNDESNEEGERVFINFVPFVKLLDNSLTPNPRIDRSEEKEYGLIFQVNAQNRIDGWSIYHRFIKTEFIDS